MGTKLLGNSRREKGCSCWRFVQDKFEKGRTPVYKKRTSGSSPNAKQGERAIPHQRQTLISHESLKKLIDLKNVLNK